jgi:hypothetical protein
MQRDIPTTTPTNLRRSLEHAARYTYDDAYKSSNEDFKLAYNSSPWVYRIAKRLQTGYIELYPKLNSGVGIVDEVASVTSPAG